MLMVMTKGSVSLSFCMVMKEEDNVDDHLWWKAGNHAFRSKVWISQMNLGNMAYV